MTRKNATCLEVVSIGLGVGQVCFGMECTIDQAGLKLIFISFKLQ